MSILSMRSKASGHFYKYRIVFYYAMTSLLIILMVAVAIYYVIDDITRSSEVAQSRNIALLITQDNRLPAAIANNKQAALKKIMTSIFITSNADYITLTNAHNIRLYHSTSTFFQKPIPDPPDDSQLRLGKYYTETKKGASGFAVSTRAPLFYQGKYVGYVAVGYLEKNRSLTVLHYFFPLSLLLLAVLVMLMVSSLFSWRLLIRQMSGLSPEVINYRYQIRRAILHAINDGIIAINREGNILLINHAAQNLLSLEDAVDTLAGKNIGSLVTPADSFLTPDFEEFRDREVTCNGSTFYASRSYIRNEVNVPVGFVISIKEKNNQSLLKTMLRQVRGESEELRVLSHEFKNKLAVISGLAEIGEYARVIKFIQRENQQHLKYREEVLTVFRASCVAGVILGKIGRARELGIALQLDPCCSYAGIYSPLSDEEMACIIGNLLDNALEATIKMPNSPQEIIFYLNDQSNEIVLSVQDNGPGPDAHLSRALLTQGTTSKNEPNHGIGLYLVNSLVQRVKGECIIEFAEEKHGTLFSVYIPCQTQPDIQEQL